MYRREPPTQAARPLIARSTVVSLHIPPQQCPPPFRLNAYFRVLQTILSSNRTKEAEMTHLGFPASLRTNAGRQAGTPLQGDPRGASPKSGPVASRAYESLEATAKGADATSYIGAVPAGRNSSLVSYTRINSLSLSVLQRPTANSRAQAHSRRTAGAQQAGRPSGVLGRQRLQRRLPIPICYFLKKRGNILVVTRREHASSAWHHRVLLQAWALKIFNVLVDCIPS